MTEKQYVNITDDTIIETSKLISMLEKKIVEQQAIIEAKDSLLSILSKENEELRRLFKEMKQPITINLTEEDEKELRKLLGLIDDE